MIKNSVTVVFKHVSYRIIKALPIVIAVTAIQIISSVLMLILNGNSTKLTNVVQGSGFMMALVCGVLLFVMIFNKRNELYLDSLYNNGKIMAFSNAILLFVIALWVVVVNMLIMPIIKIFDVMSPNLIVGEGFVASFDTVMLEALILLLLLLGVGSAIILVNKLMGKFYVITLVVGLIIGVLLIIYSGELIVSPLVVYIMQHLWALLLCEVAFAAIMFGCSFAIVYLKEMR